MEFAEEIDLSIPSPLKQRLEDDCFWIVRRDKLVSLPSELTVTTLLRAYYQHSLANTQDTNFALLAEVLDGLKVYFDFTLFDHLLYNPEKAQFKQLSDEHGFGCATVVNKIPQAHPPLLKSANNRSHTPSTNHTTHKLPSDVYGIEHFLRLFVRLPMFLSKAQLPLGHVQIIHNYVKDLFEYLTSQEGLFSDSHYEDTTPQINGLAMDPATDPMVTEQ